MAATTCAASVADRPKDDNGAGVEVICPQCGVPFIRHGRAARSSAFYRTAEENDICIVCREGLDPKEWLPVHAGPYGAGLRAQE